MQQEIDLHTADVRHPRIVLDQYDLAIVGHNIISRTLLTIWTITEPQPFLS